MAKEIRFLGIGGERVSPLKTSLTKSEQILRKPGTKEALVDGLISLLQQGTTAEQLLKSNSPLGEKEDEYTRLSDLAKKIRPAYKAMAKEIGRTFSEAEKEALGLQDPQQPVHSDIPGKKAIYP